MCDACCVDPCNRARRSTEFLHSDYREPAGILLSKYTMLQQKKRKKKQLKKMSAEMVLSQKGFSFQSHLNYY